MESRKNTLKLVFTSKSKSASHLEVLRFFAKTVNIPASKVHSVYKNENDQSFYVKLIDEQSFNEINNSMDDQYQFKYKDGEVTKVRFEMASKLFRYIRIFNLPPETEDKEIAAAMSRYGKIHQFVRERYPAEYEYPVYSGIRGVHMELEKEIPASLFIGHFRARIYYDGLKNRCFLCKAEGHLKVDCPKLISVREGETKDVAGSSKTVEQQKPLYSHVAASLKVAVTEQPQPTTSMTTLPLRNVLRRSSSDITTTKNLENTERDPIATNKAAVVQDDTNTKETSTNLDEDDDSATNPIISNTANKEAEEKEPMEVAATHTNAGKNFGKPERYASSTEEDDNPGANENRRERTTQKRRTDSVADSDESVTGKGKRGKKTTKKESVLKAIEDRSNLKTRSK